MRASERGANVARVDFVASATGASARMPKGEPVQLVHEETRRTAQAQPKGKR
jgi:hypothetical protein